MHKNIDKIKKLEGPPQVIKNVFSKTEIENFINLYQKLPTTVHNKKQNVIKKVAKRLQPRARESFYNKVKMKLVILKWII